MAWRALTSWRLAVGLLLLLATAALAGTVVLQAPPPALADRDQYNLWLGLARAKYGVLTHALDRAGLLYVYSSLWFRVAVGVLATSLVVTMLHRGPALWAGLRRTAVRDPGALLFDRAALRAVVDGPPDARDAEATVVRVLRSYRLIPVAVASDGARLLVAEKNRSFRLATLIHHAGILVVLLAGLTGGGDRFRESQFVVPVGGQREVGHDTGLTIRLTSFADEYYSDGGGVPRDYRSSIDVIEGGRVVASGVARVNHPFLFRGIRIHQSFYGLAAALHVRDEDGRTLFEDVVPLSFRAEGRPAGSVQLPDAGLEVFALAPMPGPADPVIEAGEVRLEVYPLGGRAPLAFVHLAQGESATVAGVEFTFARETRFAGLHLLRDPGMRLVWVGAFMVVAGSLLALLFPFRRVWVRMEGNTDGARPDGTRGTSVVRLATTRGSGLPFDDEFARIATDVATALTAQAPGALR